MAENTLLSLQENDRSIRVFQSFAKILPILLALWLMLSVIYYAQNCAGKIGWSLVDTCMGFRGTYPKPL